MRVVMLSHDPQRSYAGHGDLSSPFAGHAARIEPVSHDQPSWYPGGPESKPAPRPLLRVQAFLNTRDVEEATDLLAEPAPAREWLIDAGVVGRAAW